VLTMGMSAEVPLPVSQSLTADDAMSVIAADAAAANLFFGFCGAGELGIAPAHFAFEPLGWAWW